jgi:hypothetical protein
VVSNEETPDPRGGSMVPIENSSGANERVLSPEDAVCFIIHIINFFQFYDVNHLMAHRFSILIIGYEYLSLLLNIRYTGIAYRNFGHPIRKPI